MSRDDWFRNTEWNEGVESAFEAKLQRSRDKSQKLRIQACTLASTRPEVALKLLTRYFELGNHFDCAQAFVDQANAYLALGSLKDALSSYTSALSREREFPHLKTTAYVDFPFLVATQKAADWYSSALQVLEDRSADLMFPVDKFKWHASRALIFSALDKMDSAKESAHAALLAADAVSSGFRFHPHVGLVGGDYGSVQAQLGAIIAA